MTRLMIDTIKEIADQKRKSCLNSAKNAKIVRDDIFEVLKNNEGCIVLYYPLENEHIKAFHTTKQIGCESYHFVYINTDHEKEKQAFAAAHELGHIWEIDRIVGEMLQMPLSDTEREEVVNRFAAEFMMPEELFRAEAQKQAAKYLDEQKRIPLNRFFDVTVYLMDYFFQPFSAVIKRFLEMKQINEEAYRILEETNEENPSLIKNIIMEEQYSGIGVKDRTKSIKDITDLINKAANIGAVPDAKLNYLREIFEIDGSSCIKRKIEEISYGE